ncbi:MAG: hypothetical protein K8R59_01530 [Thermoanaerobaculales bacterium]|nr:hypothetical protein [Thermoanaerobaculales bacterium]
MKVLALDFDGVICQSRAEVLRVAVDAWNGLGLDPGISEAMVMEETTAETLDRLVPLGNRAEDFGVALHILGAGLPVEDQDQYDEVREGLGQAWLHDFHNAFYETRRCRREEGLPGWLALHQPYDGFVDILRRRAGETTFAITTAKDGESVRLLLGFFGISDLFADRLILDKETGISKKIHLRVLSEKLKAPLSEITFVDDKLNHVESVAELGVRAVVAGWGYNTDRELEKAKSAGFVVASLEDVEDLLFS